MVIAVQASLLLGVRSAMPRAGKEAENSSIIDSFSDADFDQWEQVSEDFGTRLEWSIGTTVTLRFIGTKEVTQEDGNTFTLSLFEDALGELYNASIPYALQEAIDNGRLKEQDIARIAVKGEATTGKGLNPVKKFDIRVKPRG